MLQVRDLARKVAEKMPWVTRGVFNLCDEKKDSKNRDMKQDKPKIQGSKQEDSENSIENRGGLLSAWRLKRS